MPKAFPEEFRRDVVAVDRKGEAPMTQIAKDFGVSPAALHRWMKIADEEDGVKSGVVTDDAAKLREVNKRIRLLEQEAEVMRRAVAYLSRDINPKKRCPRWSASWLPGTPRSRFPWQNRASELMLDHLSGQGVTGRLELVLVDRGSLRPLPVPWAGTTGSRCAASGDLSYRLAPGRVHSDHPPPPVPGARAPDVDLLPQRERRRRGAARNAA